MDVVYIAGPFRGPNAWAVEQNVRRAEMLGFEVACLGMSPLIPHTNTRFFNGTMDDQFWIDATLALLEKADAVMLVDGWQKSAGARGEVAAALDRGIPVFDLTEHLVAWRDGSPNARQIGRVQLHDAEELYAA